MGIVRAGAEAGHDIDAIWEAVKEHGLAGKLTGPVMLSGILRQARIAWTDTAGRARTREAPVAPYSGTLREAIVDVLADHPAGLTRTDISRIVSDRAGKVPSPSMVMRVVREHGRRVPPDRWRLAADA
jgi:hypothetical protein